MNSKNTKPKLIIIAGPSGVGKSTVLEKVVQKFPQLQKLKTITTRPKRIGEGESYQFVSKEEFENLIENNELVEWAKVHDFYYGSKKGDIEKMMAGGIFPIAAIDVQGVRKYKEMFPDLLAIFISYESLDKLPERLRQTRPDASEEEIQTRLQTAIKEMQAVQEYEHIVVNKEGELSGTVEKIKEIIKKKLNF